MAAAFFFGGITMFHCNINASVFAFQISAYIPGSKFGCWSHELKKISNEIKIGDKYLFIFASLIIC